MKTNKTPENENITSIKNEMKEKIKILEEKMTKQKLDLETKYKQDKSAIEKEFQQQKRSIEKQANTVSLSKLAKTRHTPPSLAPNYLQIIINSIKSWFS